MVEIWRFLIGMAVVLFGIPTAGFVVLALFEGFPKIRLGQVAGLVAILAWVFALSSVGGPGEGAVLSLGATSLILVFLATWKREFRLLMLRRDDEFPGRWDRLAWFLVIALAPAFGPWLFRSYRKARWPESSAAGPWTDGPTGRRPKSNPWDEDDVPSPATAGVA